MQQQTDHVSPDVADAIQESKIAFELPITTKVSDLQRIDSFVFHSSDKEQLKTFSPREVIELYLTELQSLDESTKDRYSDFGDAFENYPTVIKQLRTNSLSDASEEFWEIFPEFVEECFFSHTLKRYIREDNTYIGRSKLPTVGTTFSVETGEKLGILFPYIFQSPEKLLKLKSIENTRELSIEYSSEHPTEFKTVINTKTSTMELPTIIFKDIDLRFTDIFTSELSVRTHLSETSVRGEFIKMPVKRLTQKNSDVYELVVEGICDSWKFKNNKLWSEQYNPLTKLVENYGYGAVEELEFVYVKPRPRIEAISTVLEENSISPVYEQELERQHPANLYQKSSVNENFSLLLEEVSVTDYENNESSRLRQFLGL